MKEKNQKYKSISNLNNIKKVADYCDKTIDLKNARLGEEYFYQSLPLCVIDSIWSIGVNYSSVKNVVEKYCNYFQLPRLRKNRNKIPSIEEQESITEFLQKKKKIGIVKFTDKVFNNRQRTSSRSGILKSEAVFLFAKVLKKYNVEYFKDIVKIISNWRFEQEIGQIPGQRNLTALKMFFMLAGDDNLIKPDRWIGRFLESVLGYDVRAEDQQLILANATKILRGKYFRLTPRLLDHEIWKYQIQ